MSAKSIDGLQKRSTVQKTNGKKIVVRHTSAVQVKKPTAKKIAVSSPKRKRSLEVPDKKKDLKEQ